VHENSEQIQISFNLQNVPEEEFTKSIEEPKPFLKEKKSP
jgi:hypothetical protein